MKSYRTLFITFIYLLINLKASADKTDCAYILQGRLTQIAFAPGKPITNQFLFTLETRNRLWRIECLALDTSFVYQRSIMACESNTAYMITYYGQPPATAEIYHTSMPPGARLEFSVLWAALAHNCLLTNADSSVIDYPDPFSSRHPKRYTRAKLTIPSYSFGLPEQISYHYLNNDDNRVPSAKARITTTNGVYRVNEWNQVSDSKKLPKEFVFTLMNPSKASDKWYDWIGVVTNVMLTFDKIATIPPLPQDEPVQFVDVRYENWNYPIVMSITNVWPEESVIKASKEYLKWKATRLQPPKARPGLVALLALIVFTGPLVMFCRRKTQS